MQPCRRGERTRGNGTVDSGQERGGRKGQAADESVQCSAAGYTKESSGTQASAGHIVSDYCLILNSYNLLHPQKDHVRGRKTLLLDVDETLVHSSFTPTSKAEIVLPIDIEGRICNIYVQVRPGCVEFIKEVAKHYEVVIFTASLSKYAIPLMDILDEHRVAP